ncbi:MAG: hypothetical protein F6K65_42575 [Moorea sp. SIO3C2]|nr:hypothetical protein [Moorena sp. SIO3C2]
MSTPVGTGKLMQGKCRNGSSSCLSYAVRAGAGSGSAIAYHSPGRIYEELRQDGPWFEVMWVYDDGRYGTGWISGYDLEYLP